MANDAQHSGDWTVNRHVHLWEIDSDGRGPNYYEANECDSSSGVTWHDVDPYASLANVIAMFPRCTLTIHRALWLSDDATWGYTIHRAVA